MERTARKVLANTDSKSFSMLHAIDIKKIVSTCAHTCVYVHICVCTYIYMNKA